MVVAFFPLFLLSSLFSYVGIVHSVKGIPFLCWVFYTSRCHTGNKHGYLFIQSLLYQAYYVKYIISSSLSSPISVSSRWTNRLQDGLNNWVLGKLGVVHGLTPGVELASLARDPRKLIAGHAQLDQGSRLGLHPVPTGAGSRVLDPGNEHVVDGVGKGLLRRDDARKSSEALVAAVEEGHLGAVGGGGAGDADDVVVLGKEAVSPGGLDLGPQVDVVVDGAVEAGVTVQGAAAQRLGGKVGRRVGGLEHGRVELRDVGVEGADPLGKVAVLGAVDEREDGALAVGQAGQQRHVGRVLAGGEAGGVVGVARLVVDDGREDGVEEAAELRRHEGLGVDLAQALDLAAGRGAGAAELGGHLVETLVGGGEGGARHGVG